MKIVVTGTDTGVGKTLFCAALAESLRAHYWKPVQSGLQERTDSETVADLAPSASIFHEAYRLSTPCSPHRAAEIDGIPIETDKLHPPPIDPLVIEGAGGALVPVTRSLLFADLFAAWGLPVVVVARTELGTINHSLLTLEALRTRDVPVRGLAFSGEANPDSEMTIASIGRVKRLGRLPRLPGVSSSGLAAAFRQNFSMDDFL